MDSSLFSFEIMAYLFSAYSLSKRMVFGKHLPLRSAELTAARLNRLEGPPNILGTPLEDILPPSLLHASAHRRLPARLPYRALAAAARVDFGGPVAQRAAGTAVRGAAALSAPGAGARKLF